MFDPVSFVIDPFSAPFMVRALISLVCVGIVAAIVGVLVLLRGAAFAADGLTHAVFPGMAAGFVSAGMNGVVWGAIGAAIVAAVVLTVLGRTVARNDAGVAIGFAALFSVGVVIVSNKSYGGTGGLEALLFGRVLSVTDTSVVETIVVCVGVLVVFLVCLRQQVHRAFDSASTATSRSHGFALDLVFNVLVALVVVVASATVGNLLALALVLVPAAIARMITERLWVLFPVAAIVAVVCSWLGLCLAYAASVEGGIVFPAGASIVSVFVAVYVLVLAVSLVVRALSRRTSAVNNAPTDSQFARSGS